MDQAGVHVGELRERLQRHGGDTEQDECHNRREDGAGGTCPRAVPPELPGQRVRNAEASGCREEPGKVVQQFGLGTRIAGAPTARRREEADKRRHACAKHPHTDRATTTHHATVGAVRAYARTAITIGTSNVATSLRRGLLSGDHGIFATRRVIPSATKPIKRLDSGVTVRGPVSNDITIQSISGGQSKLRGQNMGAVGV